MSRKLIRQGRFYLVSQLLDKLSLVKYMRSPLWSVTPSTFISVRCKQRWDRSPKNRGITSQVNVRGLLEICFLMWTFRSRCSTIRGLSTFLTLHAGRLVVISKKSLNRDDLWITLAYFTSDPLLFAAWIPKFKQLSSASYSTIFIHIADSIIYWFRGCVFLACHLMSVLHSIFIGIEWFFLNYIFDVYRRLNDSEPFRNEWCCIYWLLHIKISINVSLYLIHRKY